MNQPTSKKKSMWPERIWLTRTPECIDGGCAGPCDNTTWCAEPIGDQDIEYVRAEPRSVAPECERSCWLKDSYTAIEGGGDPLPSRAAHEPCALTTKQRQDMIQRLVETGRIAHREPFNVPANIAYTEAHKAVFDAMGTTQPPGAGWQPIESAPDGEYVLVAHIACQRICWAQAAKRGAGVTRLCWFNPNGKSTPDPTHWMPLQPYSVPTKRPDDHCPVIDAPHVLVDGKCTHCRITPGEEVR